MTKVGLYAIGKSTTLESNKSQGRKDLARSLPGFKVLEVLFLAQVSQAFLPSKKACGIHKFRHF